MGWAQPRENSVAGICEAINRFDGVEFDLRLTADGGVVMHHDREVEASAEVVAGLPSKYVERNTLDDLMELGFENFDDLMSRSDFIDRLIEQACVACIELKVPHPSSGKGGGWFWSSARFMSQLLAKVDSLLEEHGIPIANTVYYSFHRRMWKVARLANSSRHVATLRPIVPPYGSINVQRLRSIPQFMTMPLSRLVRWHRWDRSPMIPCALEYLIPPTSRLTLGLPVGLEGRRLNRLRRLAKGLPLYVWPGDIELESKLLNAGLTPITDCADPEIYTLPCGQARWTQPATQPLDENWHHKLASSSSGQHRELVGEARREIPHWHEMGDGERRAILSRWRKRFTWHRDLDSLVADSSDISMPWEAVRMMGHRGCGKTS
ncbi:MAG TPA: hypothetical protein EYN46_02745 [Candidatus Poseidoniales archaeon]|nr:hypothetical protein [Candidatus Poseidoniales archaeon]